MPYTNLFKEIFFYTFYRASQAGNCLGNFDHTTPSADGDEGFYVGRLYFGLDGENAVIYERGVFECLMLDLDNKVGHGWWVYEMLRENYLFTTRKQGVWLPALPSEWRRSDGTYLVGSLKLCNMYTQI